jgi:nucleotide-binding universal stress UspA family protein
VNTPWNLTRIMVPLDGSALAESALPLAVHLARCQGARLCLLHIIEEHAPASIHGEPHLTDAQTASSYLDKLAERLSEGIEIETHVHGAAAQDVALSIASHVAELAADMVVMCTHGRGGPRRFVIGSNGLQVLQHVTVPVLVVQAHTRPEATPKQTASIGTILVPLDGTPDAEAALPVAASLAQSCGAHVLLVRVVATAATITGDEQAAARLLPMTAAAALDVEETEARDYLAELVKGLVAEGVPARAEVLRGERVRSLASVAQERKADMVVIATHGRAGLGAVWAGSVASGLLNSMTRPLLLIRVERS